MPEPYEWDEYAEPLWDPLRSEIQVLVEEYFAAAEAAGSEEPNAR